jgi:hypothetical protein
MIPAPTPPSGESAPPSLMDCWDDEKQIKYLKTCVMQMETALLASEHLRQHAEAEVARLTAQRDALVQQIEAEAAYQGMLRDERDAAEARAARAEEAVYRDESVRGAMDDFEGNRADLDAMYQAKDWYPAYATDYIRELNDLYRDLGSTVAAIYHYRAPAFDPPRRALTEGADR